MNDVRLYRRQFLKGTGALIVSFNLFPSASPLSAQSVQPTTPTGGEPDPTQLDSWLAIGQDGTVTIFTSKVELGTGIETALAQIAAEELDVSWRRIKVDMGDTTKTIDQATTSGSRTIERAGPQVRQAAAAARKELLRRAAEKLGAPVEKLTVRDGVVSVQGAPSKHVSYAQLIGGKRFDVKIQAEGSGGQLKLAQDVKPKDPKEYKTVGASVPRFDLPLKVTGEAVYIHDVRIPGMLHGRVVRPPVVNSAPQSIDEASIKHIPGVVKIVREGSFVGVVAKSEWAAMQAAQSLKVIWSKPTIKLPANPDELYDYLKNTKSFTTLKAADKGNPAAALSQAKKIYQATFRWPFQLHGMIGPSCAVADVRGEQVTIWSGPQGPFRTRKAVATLLNVPEKNVRVIYREASGSYGRMSNDDGAEDAALLSRAVGAPVRIQWSRQDEHGWEPKGPAQLQMLRAGVNGEGRVISWEFTDYSLPWTASSVTPLLASSQIGIKATAQGGSNGNQGGGEIYVFENQKIFAEQIPWLQAEPIPLRTSNLRAPGQLARCFASESFLNEIAADLGVDPVEFRLRYLTDDQRGTEVLKAAAQKSQWQKRSSPASSLTGTTVDGRGIAMTRRSGGYVAAVADVEVDKSTGKVTVKRITCAHDCGLIVNPDGVKNQVEGNIVQGVSRALLEEVTFDSSGVTSLDWNSYPILKFSDVPDLDIVLINRPEVAPLGAGELSTVPIPGAIANAIFDATAVRMREVPFTPKRVLAGLEALKASKPS
ncbi:MAG TPA: molybdopterin cofactor-binding domain-containing protein [Candidatus Binatia bacterium]|nr:molybdopterin cofactor-binding domain-containing protein [Candidatus Binatia bacterium]